MEESPSSEANSSSASHEIPCNIWNPMVPYHTDNSLPPVPILSHINLVSAPYPILLPKGPFSYYHLIYALVFQVVSFLQVCPGIKKKVSCTELFKKCNTQPLATRFPFLFLLIVTNVKKNKFRRQYKFNALISQMLTSLVIRNMCTTQE